MAHENDGAAGMLSAWVSCLTDDELDEVEAALRHHAPGVHSGFYYARHGATPCAECLGTGTTTRPLGSGSIRVVETKTCRQCWGKNTVDGGSP